MWLACYTDAEIASKTGQSQQMVNLKTKTFTSIIENNNTSKSRAFFMEEDFTPPLYNVWTFSKKTNEVSHFGNS